MTSSSGPAGLPACGLAAKNADGSTGARGGTGGGGGGGGVRAGGGGFRARGGGGSGRGRGRLVLALPPRSGQLTPGPLRQLCGGLIGNGGDPTGTGVATGQQGDRRHRCTRSVAVDRLRCRALFGDLRGSVTSRDRTGEFGARRRHR